MPFLVAIRNGEADMSADSLSHGGVTYPGPVFDVPVDVAQALAARAVFRYASRDELAAAQPAKPKPAKKAAARKTSE